MIHFQAPIFIKIREGIRVNLSLAVSHATEEKQPIQKLKDDIAKQVGDGSLKRQLDEKDYETVRHADTVSFWFISGSSLMYRVGEEITQEEYDRIVRELSSLEYRSKDDRKPSTSKTAEASA